MLIQRNFTMPPSVGRTPLLPAHTHEQGGIDFDTTARYHGPMHAALTLRRARLDAGLTLRALADRAGTSHATLAAYESGRAVPRVDTLDRILRAAGYAADIDVSPRPDATNAEREAKGRELVEALELAAMFPARHARRLRFPPLPRDASAP